MKGLGKIFRFNPMWLMELIGSLTKLMGEMPSCPEFKIDRQVLKDVNEVHYYFVFANEEDLQKYLKLDDILAVTAKKITDIIKEQKEQEKPKKQ